MIYTITLNPSVDYVAKTGELKTGGLNRTTEETFLPGGKGINVSLVLSELGVPNKALGFLGGFTGHFIEEELKKTGCQTEFIYLPDQISRINMKIRTEDQETEINGQGPYISRSQLECLYQKLEKLQEGDFLVISGSIPSSMPEDSYEKILKRLEGKGIQFTADTTNEKLLNLLKYHPFLIKPNHHELGEVFGVTCKNEKEIIYYAKKLKEMGARNVLVSMAEEGAVLVNEEGKILRVRSPKGTVINSVGAGDSMLAGFLAGYLKTRDFVHALKLASASGSASAFQLWLAQKEDIQKLYEEVHILYR